MAPEEEVMVERVELAEILELQQLGNNEGKEYKYGGTEEKRHGN